MSLSTDYAVQGSGGQTVDEYLKVRKHTIEVRSVLASFASQEEGESLGQILGGAGWSLRIAQTFAEAEAALRSFSFGVVLCGGHLADGHGWKDVLNVIHRMPIPAQLIVADRLADEALWAEVLNLGGYDLLATPFEPEEVLRVVPMAWDFWERESARAEMRRKPLESAKPWCQPQGKTLAAGTD